MIREQVHYPSSGSSSPRPMSLLIWLAIIGIALFVTGSVLFHEFPRLLPGEPSVRPSNHMFLLLILGMAAGAGLFGYGFILGHRKRWVETTPTCPIRSLAMGLVEIIGTAETDGPPLQAPLSQFPCVLYTYRVEEERGSGDHRRWKTVAEGASHQPFGVRDATGVVQVFPDGADLMLQDDRTYRNDWLGELSPTVTTGLARLGIPSNDWLGTKTVRCRESCLLPGAPVYVLGIAQHKTSAESRHTEPRLFVGQGPDAPLFISDRGEQELLAQWRRQIHLYLWGGPILTVACLLAILKWYPGTAP
jgi:hypothetical protein